MGSVVPLFEDRIGPVQRIAIAVARDGSDIETDRLMVVARSLAAERALRIETFPADYGCEAPWSFLVDLYVADAAGRALDIARLAQASAMPVTSAVRWMAALVRDGMVYSPAGQPARPDATIRLTTAGRRKLTDYLGQVARIRALAAV